jgi:hypothetical protein
MRTRKMSWVCQACRLPGVGCLWIVLAVAGCDHIDHTSLRVDPDTRAVQQQSLREDEVAAVVDDVACTWGFKAFPPGENYSGNDVPNIIRWYVVGYPNNANHIYLTLKKPERLKSEMIQVRLEEVFAWSESERKAMIRRDLLSRLRQRFGPDAVRQER